MPTGKPTKTTRRSKAANTKSSAASAARKPRTASGATRRAAPAASAASPAAPATAGPRRAVFIDVENTSSESDLIRVLDDLAIDRGTTELTAVGNWRVVGQQLGRTLAQRGAHLVHSAPAPRVPDWSDLWIAVSAGMWLGRAQPGDVIDIISDDRAFDAVGDAASRLGVAFRRITYRTAPADRVAAEAVGERRGGRRRRRKRGPGAGVRPPIGPRVRPHVAVVASAPPPLSGDEDEPHGASHEHIRATIARLSAPDPERGVNLDALAAALKAEGYQRPPGSPRLVTRLRRIKDVAVLANGRVRLVGAAAEAGAASAASDAGGESAESNGQLTPGTSDGAPGQPKRRARRRGGRRRSGRRRGATAPSVAGE